MVAELAYLAALVVIGLGFVGIILALGILEVSKGKFIASLIISLVLIALGGYYYYVIGQYQKGVNSPNKLNILLKVSPSTETEFAPQIELPVKK